MPTAKDIVRNARHRELLRERQAGETLRSVFLLDGAHVAKRFRFPVSSPSHRRPWIAEHEALTRLDGAGAPRTFGWFDEIEGDQRVVWLVKEYVVGSPLASFVVADVPAAARLMARIHECRIVTDDANPGNFIRTPDGRLAFLDFGRAKGFASSDPRFQLFVGWELAKLRREGFRWNADLWNAFLPLYFQARPSSMARRTLVLAACSASAALRKARKMSQGKSPRS